MNHNTEPIRAARKSQSCDAVAEWYAGWSGPEGSRHHRELAIPALIDLLAPQTGERILDIGCGAGALAPAVLRAKALFTGVDLSPKLIAIARKHHGGKAHFLVGDATRLDGLPHKTFDAATFLLSLQDISPLQDALVAAARVLKPGGRLVILMTHPCFRIPRQSGWGWDEGRRLQFRRVDRYMTPLDVPMQQHRGGATRSYHRPLQDYAEALVASGFTIDRLKEITGMPPSPGKPEPRAERLAREQIPLFLGLSASLSFGKSQAAVLAPAAKARCTAT